MKRMCHAEDVGFYKKRDDPSIKYPKKYFVGSCSFNKYRDVKRCSIGAKNKKTCTTTKEKRKYSQIKAHPPIILKEFYGKIFCGERL